MDADFQPVLTAGGFPAEFEEAADLLAVNPDATTTSISERQSHVAVDVSTGYEEGELGEETDKTEVRGKAEQGGGLAGLSGLQGLSPPGGTGHNPSQGPSCPISSD